MSEEPLDPTEDEPSLSSETYRELVTMKKVGSQAVRKAQAENRERGIPNVYSIQGHLYYEQPDGTLALTDPFVSNDEHMTS